MFQHFSKIFNHTKLVKIADAKCVGTILHSSPVLIEIIDRQKTAERDHVFSGAFQDLSVESEWFTTTPLSDLYL